MKIKLYSANKDFGVELHWISKGIVMEHYWYVSSVTKELVHRTREMAPCPAEFTKNIVLARAGGNMKQYLPYLIPTSYSQYSLETGECTPWNTWYSELTDTNPGTKPAIRFDKKKLYDHIKDIDFRVYDGKLADSIIEQFIVNGEKPKVEVEIDELDE